MINDNYLGFLLNRIRERQNEINHHLNQIAQFKVCSNDLLLNMGGLFNSYCDQHCFYELLIKYMCETNIIGTLNYDYFMDLLNPNKILEDILKKEDKDE